MQNDNSKLKFTLRLCTCHCSMDIQQQQHLGESYCKLCGVECGLDSIFCLDMGANFTTLLGVIVFRWLNIPQL